MQIITDFLIAGLAAYLAFTNYLAGGILALLDEQPKTTSVEEVTSPTSSIASLPSLFNSSLIPDILLKSTSYQSAALATAVSDDVYTTNPLDAIVNIFCTFTTPTTIRTTTGTGFFIHSAGVIMTNAHVAQYLLLETTNLLGEADCIVRSGNPAVAKYKAELLYIPPAWVQKNAAVIDSAAPTGTGERDYALIYASEGLNGEPLPARFPALRFNSDLLSHAITGKAVQAAGYPATDLIRNGASTPLIPRHATSSISELYTFGSNYADVFSIKGSEVGAEGSSGGPVLNSDHEVIGMIATRGDDAVDGIGSLRAITISHIHRTILEETGFSLERNVTGNLPYRSKIFRETLSPFLVGLLATELAN